MVQHLGRYQLQAAWIFDLEDHYVRLLGTYGPHPRPIEPLRFWLIDERTAGKPRSLPLPLEMRMVTNASGYRTFFGELRQAGADWRRYQLGDGVYTIRITSPHYQSASRADIGLPMHNPLLPDNGPLDPPYRFDLLPGPGYPFRGVEPLPVAQTAVRCTGNSEVEGRGPTLLRGTWVGQDGKPVIGASIQATVGAAVTVVETDVLGQWLFAFPPTQPTAEVSLSFTPPTGPVVNLEHVCIVRGRQVTVANTSLRGSVWHHGAPAANATVRVDGQPATVKTDAVGAWIYYFALDQPAPAQATVNVTLSSGISQTTPQFDVPFGRTTNVLPIRF